MRTGICQFLDWENGIYLVHWDLEFTTEKGIDNFKKNENGISLL